MLELTCFFERTSVFTICWEWTKKIKNESHNWPDTHRGFEQCSRVLQQLLVSAELCCSQARVTLLLNCGTDIATLELAAQKAYMFLCLSCARCYIVSRESRLLCWCRRCCDFSHLASETERNNVTEQEGNAHTQTPTKRITSLNHSEAPSHPFIPLVILSFSHILKAHAWTNTCACGHTHTHCSHQKAHTMLFYETQQSFCSLLPQNHQKNGKS